VTQPIMQRIVRYMAARLARKQIESAVAFGGEFDSQRFTNEAANSYWKRKSCDFNFEKGYGDEWYKLGQKDALNGIFRSKEIAIDSYKRGWLNEIYALSHQGWINPKIIKNYGWLDNHVINEYRIIKTNYIDQLNWDDPEV